jgi:hypothetical protein
VKTTYIADEVRRFIHDNINSVEQLEVLLLLRSERSKQWCATEVSRRLFTVPASAAMRLDDLHQRSLLQKIEGEGEPLYSYQPQDARLDDTIAKLDQVYRERKDAVIQAIFSRPPDRIQTFSDAFRIRRDN